MTRLQPDQLAALDAWIAKQREPVTRPEAIRRLVELGLKAKPTLPLHIKKAAARAAKIAEQHIDPLIEPSTPPEERHSRKRKLIKAPRSSVTFAPTFRSPRGADHPAATASQAGSAKV